LKKSLFSKLLIMNIGVIAAALVVIALLLPQLISGYIFNQKERELTAKGTELARLTEGYLEETISEESFLELLASLDRFLEARIWVVNRDGLVIKASYGERLFRRGPYLRLSEEQVKQLSRGETLTARRYLPHFEQVMLSVGVPVLFGADRVPAGAIILHAPVTEIKATVSSLLKFVLFSGLAAVALQQDDRWEPRWRPWPGETLKAEGNDGMVQTLRATPGAIAYVSYEIGRAHV